MAAGVFRFLSLALAAVALSSGCRGGDGIREGAPHTVPLPGGLWPDATSPQLVPRPEPHLPPQSIPLPQPPRSSSEFRRQDLPLSENPSDDRNDDVGFPSRPEPRYRLMLTPPITEPVEAEQKLVPGTGRPPRLLERIGGPVRRLLDHTGNASHDQAAQFSVPPVFPSEARGSLQPTGLSEPSAGPTPPRLFPLEVPNWAGHAMPHGGS